MNHSALERFSRTGLRRGRPGAAGAVAVVLRATRDDFHRSVVLSLRPSTGRSRFFAFPSSLLGLQEKRERNGTISKRTLK